MRCHPWYIRRILHVIADAPFAWDSQAIDDIDGPTVGWHIALMIEHGLLTGVDMTAHSKSVGLSFINCRLTWRGHDWLAVTRDAQRFEQRLAALGEEPHLDTLYQLLLRDYQLKQGLLGHES